MMSCDFFNTINVCRYVLIGIVLLLICSFVDGIYTHWSMLAIGIKTLTAMSHILRFLFNFERCFICEAHSLDQTLTVAVCHTCHTLLSHIDC